MLLIITFLSLAHAELVYVATLWRHGDRAPSDRFSDPRNARFFPNGIGNLTPAGYQRAFQLGRTFRQRYVDTGFLRDFSQEMAVSSVFIPRCVESGRAVIEGMLREQTLAPSIQTPPPLITPTVYDFEETCEKKPELKVLPRDDDYMLNAPWSSCAPKSRYFERLCPGITPMNKYEGEYSRFESAMFACLRERHNLTVDVFARQERFEQIEALINEDHTGYPLHRPSWYTDAAREEALRIHYTLNRAVIGCGEFRSRFDGEDVLQANAGEVIHAILDDIENVTTCYPYCEEVVKFRGFSSQDWLLFSLLSSLSLREVALGPTHSPAFSSALLVEVHWDGDWMVKVLFTTPSPLYHFPPTDLTPSLCGLSLCPLSSLLERMQPFESRDSRLLCDN